MRPRFDAVVFDLFGTLVDEWTVEQRDAAFRELADALGADVEVFAREWLASAGPRLTGGFATIEDNLAHIARSLDLDLPPGALDEAVRLRTTRMRDLLTPRDDAVPALRALRERGLRTALVSMCSPEVPDLWASTPLAPLVDAVVFSSVDGLRKPDPAIYALAADRLGVDAARCLYVGDGSFGELTGAAAAGMTPVLIRAAHEDGQVIERAEEDVAWVGPRIAAVADVLPIAAGVTPSGTP